MHMVPQVRRLEYRFPNELVFIGVHSPKFTAEQDIANLRKAVRRYNIRHPVVNDAAFQVWQSYAARAWPTFVLIDPLGRILGYHQGEFPYEALEQTIGMVVQHYSQRGQLNPVPLEFQTDRENSGMVAFPGKVLADAASGRLFIADTGHYGVQVWTLDGRVVDVFGSGQPGYMNGDSRRAQFASPQGMALRRNFLYIADTENHAIRSIDLGTDRVETVAGTGDPGHSLQPGPSSRRTRLNSPWDLALVGDTLYVAMAGLHQLWAMDLVLEQIGPVAGAGPEGLKDGPGQDAWLAQPSGLTTNGETVYFADSETSSIRMMTPGREVHTLVGTGLFDFGDRDGVGEQARLQHPLGLCWHDDMLYIADSYNHKLKRLDPRTRHCVTIAGSGRPGLKDGRGVEASFSEPGGLAAINGKLYVADTNNHAIRVVDLATAEVTTLTMQ